MDAHSILCFGAKSFARSDYAKAGGYYKHAVALDPGFALAEIALLRVENANNNESAGISHLRRAQALRNRLTARDQLYVDAWTARIDTPAEELSKWEQMANLYPDDFPAAMNVGYIMIERNRYADGLVAVQRANSTKNPAYAQTQRLLGDFLLAEERYAESERAQTIALAQGVQAAAIRKVIIYAAQGRFAEAEKAWQRVRVAKDTGVRFDRVSLYLDQGDWQAAIREAKLLGTYPEAGTVASRSALYPLAVSEWFGGNQQRALQTLDELLKSALAGVESPVSSSDAVADAYVAISSALLAQRMGDRERSRRVLLALGKQPELLKVSPVSELLEVLRAGETLLEENPDLAIAQLKELLAGNPPYQARALLLSAYLAAGKVDEASAQADWLGSHRGRAYVEQGCGWCQQPLNVVDTTLGRLSVAELLAKQGRAGEARVQLQAFDRRWPLATLPDHLRVRPRRWMRSTESAGVPGRRSGWP